MKALLCGCAKDLTPALCSPYAFMVAAILAQLQGVCSAGVPTDGTGSPIQLRIVSNNYGIYTLQINFEMSSKQPHNKTTLCLPLLVYWHKVLLGRREDSAAWRGKGFIKQSNAWFSNTPCCQDACNRRLGRTTKTLSLAVLCVLGRNQTVGKS